MMKKKEKKMYTCPACHQKPYRIEKGEKQTGEKKTGKENGRPARAGVVMLRLSTHSRNDERRGESMVMLTVKETDSSRDTDRW